MQHYQQRTSGRAIKPACAYPSRCIVGYLCGQQEPRHSSPHSNSTVDLHAFYTAHSAWGGGKLCKSIPDIDFLVHIKMCIQIIFKKPPKTCISDFHPTQASFSPPSCRTKKKKKKKKKKGMGALRHQFEWHACPEISHEIKTAYKVLFFPFLNPPPPSVTALLDETRYSSQIGSSFFFFFFFRKCNHKPCSG